MEALNISLVPCYILGKFPRNSLKVKGEIISKIKANQGCVTLMEIFGQFLLKVISRLALCGKKRNRLVNLYTSDLRTGENV